MRALENSHELSRRRDSHAVVLSKIEEIRITGYDVRRAPGDRAGEVLVIVWVRTQSWKFFGVVAEL